MARRLTLDDIAHHAGVSKATVSRVLGRHPERYDVDPETRGKVTRAAEALGWDGFAPRKERPETVVAMLYEATTGSPGDGIAVALASAAHMAGVVLTFEPVTKPISAWRQRFEHHLRPGAGLVVSPVPVDPESLAQMPIPLVVVNQMTSLALPHVAPDDVAGGLLLGQRLWAFGHRRVWYLAPPLTNHFSVGERATGLAQAGLQVDFFPGDGAETVVERMRFRTSGRPTAIVCWTWLTAIEALFACHRHGLKVPEDLSVVCFDDHHAAATSHPPLTVVDPQHQRVAAEAIRLVLAGERAPKVHRTPVALFARLSDGPAPTR